MQRLFLLRNGLAGWASLLSMQQLLSKSKVLHSLVVWFEALCGQSAPGDGAALLLEVTLE